MLSRVLTITCLGACLLLPVTVFGTNHEISISGFTFVPPKVRVSYGDTVTWTNADEFQHTATSTGGSAKSFNSGTLNFGASYSIVINPSDGRGPFPYFCSIHPTMVDTIFVATRHTVNVTGFDFKPVGLVINPGDTVVWVNLDAVQHTTTSDPGSSKSWDSDLLSQNESHEEVFAGANGPGPFPYHCTPHPDMKDTLTFNPLFCCTGTTGNVNMAGIVDGGDLALLVAYLTNPPLQKPALPCVAEANVNGSGIIDGGDLALLVAYLTNPPLQKPTLPNCPS